MKRKIFSMFLFQMLLFLAPIIARGAVFINEVAWMGNSSNGNAEWIEIYNGGGDDIDLSGWTISGSISIVFTDGKHLVSDGYFLLERTSDNTIPEITADQIYTGALPNTGGNLTLKDKDGNIVDSLQFSSGWPAGDNTTKETMQRLLGSWYTALPTPKAPTPSSASDNSSSVAVNSQNSSSASSNDTSSAQVLKNSYREMSAKIKTSYTTIPAGITQNFKGIVYGNYGEEVERGLVLWNFGDGSIKQASSFETVSHTYKFPGEYVVSLQHFKNAIVGEVDAETRLNIKVVKAELAISSIGTMESPYIEIENKSSHEISLKDWKLIANGKLFTFPSGTYIQAGRKNIFDLEFLGLELSDINPIVLFRPGFQVESTYPLDYKVINFTQDIVKPTPSNYTKTKELEESHTRPEPVNLNLLNNQEASASSADIGIPYWAILIIIIASAISIVYFLRNRKIQKSEVDIDNLRSEDIDIIE